VKYHVGVNLRTKGTNDSHAHAHARIDDRAGQFIGFLHGRISRAAPMSIAPDYGLRRSPGRN